MSQRASHKSIGVKYSLIVFFFGGGGGGGGDTSRSVLTLLVKSEISFILN